MTRANATMDGTVGMPTEFAARYRREGYWTGRTLAELARGPAADRSRPALVTATGSMSYAELDERADRLASGLHELGVRRTDRVVVALPNRPELVTTLLALFRLGAVPVLALPAHRRLELVHLCRHTDAVALVVPDVHLRFDHRALAREVAEAVPGLAHVLVAGEPDGLTALADVDAEPLALPDPDPESVALLLLSGGTSGLPKLIPRTHDDYAFQIGATAAAMGLDRDGAYLAALPAAHNAALGCPGVLGALQVGARVVLAPSPSPDEVFDLIAREGVTLTTLMPVFLPLWSETAAAYGVDLSRLVVEVGGAHLSAEAARAAEAALGATVTRWFGISEGVLSFTRPDDPADVRLGTEGRPLCAADEVLVVDEDDTPVPDGGGAGELLIRGPYTLRGYYRAEEHNARAFTADGFFRTGDLVRRTAAGNLVVVGRIKDVVNRGGEKVSAEEVETLLRAHPDVRDAAVVAVPDARLGERACAVVVGRDGTSPTLLELRAHLTDLGCAEYKQPDRLLVVPVLPMTPVGKVDKSLLARAATEPGAQPREERTGA